ncbi:hypothetical protein BG61_39660 [Caballeronia glathei]|jgi:hypothetical protein|uniref:Uncharacterized protein n=2 Tax=Caballeronia glathei TaxID=60547 RepID=A0A069PF87_9BURK|nr:hypothetical protein BG61_39660 [Caballeronia glathei]
MYTLKELSMKARHIATAIAAGLFTIAGAAQAQMPAEAQQLVQTMRPIQSIHPASAQTVDTARAASVDDSSYGGMPATRSDAAQGPRQSTCTAPQCGIFFGQ